MFKQLEIPVGKDVKDLFTDSFRDDAYRLIKIIILDDEMRVGSFKELPQTGDREFAGLVLPLLEDDAPCYMLYRLDSPDNRDYMWIFLTWCPDHASVIDKMTYAALCGKLKDEFGRSVIYDGFSAATKNEVAGGFERILAAWQKRA